MIYTVDSFIMINLKLFLKLDSFQYIPNCMQMLVALEHFVPFAPPPLQQKRGILRSKYHRKQQRKQFPKTRSSEQQFFANS